MVGAVIGNYQLIQKLGEGGMGAVYLGQHTLLGRRAAIKVLLPMLSARPDIVNRFFNEARAVTSISDPGIVQVFDFGYHTDGSAFIVMEYLDGEPLDRRLARLGRLPAIEALRLGRQLASSLAAAHAQHIVHRDLKPENVFLVPDAEVASGERAKILDFGIAKLSDDHPGKLKTSTGMLMGTPVYMSPEQCRGLAEVDHRSDVYALGCVLFHLMTGRPPFEGEAPGDVIVAHIRELAPAPSSRVPEILASVDALVLRCLAKAPAERFQTMGEVGAAIGQVLQQVTTGAPVGAAPRHLLPTAVAPAVVPATPTTLHTSAGQLATVAPRPRRTGLWIGLAAGLVVGAAGIAIAMVEMRGSDGSRAVSQPAEPGLIAGGSSTASGGGGSGGSRVAEDAGAVTGELPRAPDAAEQVAVNVTDAAVAVPAVGPAGGSDRTVEPPPNGPNGGDDGARGPRDAGDPAHPKRKTPHRKRLATDAPPHEEPPQASRPQPPAGKPQPPPAKSPQPAAGKCAKTAFAVVYNAAAPSKDAIKAALSTLRECHTAGAMNDADFDETQAALVAKLMARS